MTTTPSRAGYVEEYRTTLKNTKGALAARLAIFNEDNALLVAMVEKQAQGLAEAEKALKDHALAVYNILTDEERAQSGVKKSVLGATITERRVVNYDTTKAHEFAQANPTFMRPESVDKRALDAYMKGLPAAQRPDWVAITIALGVNLDTDMARSIEKHQEETA